MYHGADETECVRVVERAVQSGINLIDTAPWYGHGVAETILGKVLYIPQCLQFLAKVLNTSYFYNFLFFRRSTTFRVTSFFWQQKLDVTKLTTTKCSISRELFCCLHFPQESLFCFLLVFFVWSVRSGRCAVLTRVSRAWASNTSTSFKFMTWNSLPTSTLFSTKHFRLSRKWRNRGRRGTLESQDILSNSSGES